jgi:predicted metal-dependent phosphoesterase TrpH
MNLSTTNLVLAPDTAVDLHLHTIYSDGTWMPEQLLDYLVREQFGLVAISDHDRVDTVAAFQQLALDKHLPVLVAVEMTTLWQGEATDVLCFGFDPARNALDGLTQDLLRRQSENTREVYENLLRKGYRFPQASDPLASLLEQPGAQQPNALIALLTRHGYGTDKPSAGDIVFGSGCTFAANDIAEVVDAAHQSGAVCLIAHPGRTDGFVTYDVVLLDKLRLEAPFDGLEVHYPVHTPQQTAMYLEYAQQHHLLISSGSDSHGPHKPPIQYPAELSWTLLERVGIQIKA